MAKLEKDPQQLQLRVFSKIEGGRGKSDVLSSSTTLLSVSAGCGHPATLGVESSEDRAIYQSIAERYFKSER